MCALREVLKSYSSTHLRAGSGFLSGILLLCAWMLLSVEMELSLLQDDYRFVRVGYSVAELKPCDILAKLLQYPVSKERTQANFSTYGLCRKG